MATTPGPWFAVLEEGDGPADVWQIKTVDRPDVAFYVAHVFEGAPKDEKGGNNAKMIAASPDMADVLVALREALDMRYDGSVDSSTRWMGPHLELIRATLKRAGRDE